LAGRRVYPDAMGRGLVIAWLSLLLVGMQQQLVVHELEHLQERLERGNDVVAQSPDEASCVECSLLSGSSNVVSVDATVEFSLAHAAGSLAVADEPSPAKPLPPYYLSRAPPTFV
jgi:hypothetical protein